MFRGGTRALLYTVVGSVSAGVGAPGRNALASVAWMAAERSTTVMRMASLGQAWTQAGASPWPRRSLHMSHLRTIPRSLLNLGASYGHMNTQYWQPMHWSSRCLTMPVTGSFS